MIADGDAGHARAHFAHDARAFMAEDRGEDAFAVEAVERVGVGVADAGGLDLDQHFAGLGAFEVEFDDFQRLLGRERDRRFGFHGAPLPKECGAL